MPWYSPHYAIGAVAFARIDDDARHDILHRNAEELLSKAELHSWNKQEEESPA